MTLIPSSHTSSEAESQSVETHSDQSTKLTLDDLPRYSSKRFMDEYGSIFPVIMTVAPIVMTWRDRPRHGILSTGHYDRLLEGAIRHTQSVQRVDHLLPEQEDEWRTHHRWYEDLRSSVVYDTPKFISTGTLYVAVCLQHQQLEELVQLQPPQEQDTCLRALVCSQLRERLMPHR